MIKFQVGLMPCVFQEANLSKARLLEENEQVFLIIFLIVIFFEILQLSVSLKLSVDREALAANEQVPH